MLSILIQMPVLNIRRVFFTALIVAAGVPNVAAAGGFDSLITASDAIAYTLEKGLVARTADNRYQASAVELVAARQALLPSAQAALSVDSRYALPSNNNSRVAAAGVSGNYELSPSKYRAYRAQQGVCLADNKSTQQQREDAAIGVLLDYLQVVTAGKLIAAAAENLDYEERKLDEVEMLAGQGVKAKSDILQQRTAVAEAQSQLLSARTSYEMVRNELYDQLGLQFTGNYRFDSSAIGAIITGLSVDSLRYWRALVREREDVLAARIRVAAAEVKLGAQRLLYVPSISFSGGWTGNRRTSPGGSGAISPADQSGAVSVGASVEIPFFDRRERSLQVQRAETSLQGELLELERVERTNKLAIMQAALDDTMAQLQADVANIRCLAAAEALQAVEERYRAGTSTLNEFNSIRSGYSEAVTMLVNARFNLVSSRIRLLHTVGRADIIIAVVKSRAVEER